MANHKLPPEERRVAFNVRVHPTKRARLLTHAKNRKQTIRKSFEQAIDLLPLP
jgi:hypothetical protein